MYSPITIKSILYKYHCFPYAFAAILCPIPSSLYSILIILSNPNLLLATNIIINLNSSSQKERITKSIMIKAIVLNMLFVKCTIMSVARVNTRRMSTSSKRRKKMEAANKLGTSLDILRNYYQLFSP